MASLLATIIAAAVAVTGWSLGWLGSDIQPPSLTALAEQSLLAEQEPPPQPLGNPGAASPFIMRVETHRGRSWDYFPKENRPSRDDQFMIPLNGNYSYNFTVDWGDGTSEVIIRMFPADLAKPNALFPTHTYASQEGIYLIKITENIVGGFPAIYFNNQGDRRKVLDISQWGGGTWKTMTGAFSGCENMTISAVDSEAAVTGKITDFSSAWRGCSSLTNFPFINTAAGIDFSEAWGYCSSLTSFPLIETAAGKDFMGTWRNCRSLTSFPLIDTAAGIDFSVAWWGCRRLTSFPIIDTAAGLDFSFTWIYCSSLTNFPFINTASGRDFRDAWKGCTSLSSFPLINTAAGKDFKGAWQGCTSLSSFPLINTAAGTDFRAAWQGCTSLTSFPLINTAAGNYFDEAWQGCSSLTSFPLINTSKGTDFSNAWQGCSKMSNFPLIDTAAGINFIEAWANCASLTNFPLLNFAMMEKGADCFGKVSLNSNSYDELLSRLASMNHKRNVEFGGGFSRAKGMVGMQAREKLVKERGWKIFDSGNPKPRPQSIDEPAAPRPQEANDF